MMKKKDPIKGAQLKPSPKKNINKESQKASPKINKAIVDSQSKLKAKMDDKAKKKKNMKTALVAGATAVGVGAKMAYDHYHAQLDKSYQNKHSASHADKGPYGNTPTNKQLRKWKKEGSN